MNPQSPHLPLPATPTSWWPIFVLALGLFCIQAACYQSGLLVRPGELVDPDGYSRLLRVQHLADTGNWFDPVVPRSNPLVPETNQWCRWIDLLLLGGGHVLNLVPGVQDGLFLWAVLFSPFFLALCGPALAWALHPLLDARGRFFAVLLFFLQPGVLIYLAAGRPDHHGVLLLLMIGVLGCTLRALIPGPAAVRWAAAAGVCQSLALTVSIEALVSCLLGLVVTGLAWLLGRPDGLRIARAHATALFLTALAGVSTTISWSQWTLTESDRLAPAYLVALGSVCLFWTALGWHAARWPAVHQRLFSTWPRRLLCAGAGGLGSLLLTLGIAPVLLLHPQLTVNPRIGALWLRSIQEYHPLAERWTDLPSAIFLWMGPALLVLPWLGHRLILLNRDDAAWLSWFYSFVGLFVFTTLHLLQIRWCTYFEVFLILPWTTLLVGILRRVEGYGASRPVFPPLLPLLRIAVLFIFACGFPLLGLVSRVNREPAGTGKKGSVSDAPSRHEADLRSLAAWLNGADFDDTAPETILTLLDFGPELLYRTPHHLIATPNHRNADGILFLYDTLSGPTAGALAHLAHKKVTLLILAPASHEAEFYLQENPTASLYQDLIQGKTPPYLRPLALPPALADFRVYRVLP